MEDVILYVKAGDPYSDMTKNLLKYFKVDYDMIEVSRSVKLMEELEQISGQSNTPVLKVGEKVFVGFDREKIKEVLGIDEDSN